MHGVEVLRGHVLREWIDINDHMNVAYYTMAFDRALDEIYEAAAAGLIAFARADHAALEGPDG